MANKEFILRTNRDMQRLQDFLCELQLDAEKPQTVCVYDHTKTHSRAQQGLYRRHVEDVAKWRMKYRNDQGNTFHEMKDIVHKALKKTYLHPILMMATTKEAQDYQELYEALSVLEKSGQYSEADVTRLKNKNLSTKRCSMKLMSQFIDAYTVPMSQMGVVLTNPEEKENETE